MANTPPPPQHRPRDGDVPRPAPDGAPAARRVTSESLLGGAVELQIDHGGVLYRLRQTSLGKLILTI